MDETVLRSQVRPLHYWPNSNEQLRYVWSCREIPRMLSRYRVQGTLFTNKATFVIQIPGMETEKNSTRYSFYITPYFIVISALFGLPYFSTLCHKRYDLSDEIHWTKMCVFFPLQFSSEIFLILSNTELDMIIDVYKCLCKVHDILVRF
jgi:hypothetical protein